MANPQYVILELAATSKRLEKEDIIKRELVKVNVEFFDGARLALDNLITFGVKKVPIHGGPDGQGLPWAAFKQLTDLLSSRQLTGHAARDAIELTMSAATVSEWNDWYRRILIKDLRCGITESTINKMIKETPTVAPVPVFECMLAQPGEKHEKKLVGSKLVEPKLDGMRILTFVNMENRTVTQYSREGHVLENFTHITSQIEQHMDLLDRSYVLDGEIVSDSFRKLMKQAKRKYDVQATDARLMLFDIVPLSEFLSGNCTMSQKKRSIMLRNFKPVFDTFKYVDVIEQEEMDLSTAIGEIQLAGFNQQAIDRGFEGIMIKSPTAKYQLKRTTDWLKVKPWIEVSLTIVGAEEGTGRNVGRLGDLLCEGVDDGKRIVCSVGSGFSDQQRQEIWDSLADQIGQVVEIRADALTQNQKDPSVYSLRFPRFQMFRGFKAGEKI